MSDLHRRILGIAILVLVPLLLLGAAVPVLFSILGHILVVLFYIALLLLACALLVAPFAGGGYVFQKWYRKVFFRKTPPSTTP